GWDEYRRLLGCRRSLGRRDRGVLSGCGCDLLARDLVSGRTVGQAVAALLLLVLAVFTYPGADLASIGVWFTPRATIGSPSAEAGALAWLHVEHPAGRTAYIADPQGRLVVLHGAIPGGMID